MDIMELLRMLRAGESERVIAERLRYNRRTVAKYHTWAREHGLLTGDLPTIREIHQLLTATMPTPLPPHHITQRGNRRQQTFFSDEDYRAYLTLMSEWCGRCGVLA